MSPVRQIPALNLELGRNLAEAARAKAAELGINVAAAVVDPGGALITVDVMDGTPKLCIDIAIDKAWSTANFPVPTDQWWPILKDSPALAEGFPHRPRLVVFGGGAPVLVGGQVAGGIGVSGGSAEQDVECAEAAIAAVADLL